MTDTTNEAIAALCERCTTRAAELEHEADVSAMEVVALEPLSDAEWAKFEASKNDLAAHRWRTFYDRLKGIKSSVKMTREDVAHYRDLRATIEALQAERDAALADETCPVCNGEMADPPTSGSFCPAGCRSGIVRQTSAQVLRNVRPFWLAEGARQARLVAMRDRQLQQSARYWLRAADMALVGDTQELRNRVQIHREPPREMTLSSDHLKETGQ